jgi:RHS repeat-associated protein
MSFLKDLSEDRLSPSWLEHRMALPEGNREKEAAKQSQAYGCTPSTTHIDAKGRPFLVQKKLTDSQNIFVRTVFNHVDKPAKIQDTGGRFVSATSYDLLGRQIHQLALDSGESWMLHTASGEAFQTFNDHGGRLRNVYDKLRRNIAVFCRTASTSKEYMMTKTTYGSSSEFNNKGHVVRNYDQSGLTSTPYWDFKGNCLSKDVQLAKQYSTELDWQRDNPLEDAIYRTACRYDALNRITSFIAPDETVTKTTYLRGGLVGSTQVNIRSEKDVKGWKWKSVTSNKQYDAHARLISETQGNGTVVKVEFDPLTQATSRRQAQLKGVVLQDISFTRDVQQRITYASRTSQVPDIVRLAGSADSAYVYDALGRLIKSTGREDIAQSKGRPDAPGTEGLKADSTGMRRYTEDYTYDIYNNMLSIDHKIEDPKYSGWLRKMTYAEQTILGETFTGNRLATSTIGKTTEKYEYDSAGNTISMPHLSKVSWDILNHMRSSATQMTSSGVPETTWYVYNSAGERTRKVTERYRSANEPVRKLSEHIYIDGFDVYREYGGRGVETKSCESVRVLESEQPLLIIEHWSDRGSTPLMRYPIADEHSSISLELDDTGQMISYEEYSGFGGTTHRTLRKNIPKPFRFATKRRDQETSLYYFGGRYYAPWLCRWMNPDPSGLVDGTNTYIYCGADPVNHVDPDGHTREGQTNQEIRPPANHPLSNARRRLLSGSSDSSPAPPEPVRNSVDRPRPAPFGGNLLATTQRNINAHARQQMFNGGNPIYIIALMASSRAVGHLDLALAPTHRRLTSPMYRAGPDDGFLGRLADNITPADLGQTAMVKYAVIASVGQLGKQVLQRLPMQRNPLIAFKIATYTGLTGWLLQSWADRKADDYFGKTPASKIVDPAAFGYLAIRGAADLRTAMQSGDGVNIGQALGSAKAALLTAPKDVRDLKASHDAVNERHQEKHQTRR